MSDWRKNFVISEILVTDSDIVCSRVSNVFDDYAVRIDIKRRVL